MNIKRIKKDFFQIRKAFFAYNQGFAYINGKYFLAKKIYNVGIIEKPITNHNLSIHSLTGVSDFTMFLWSLHSFYNTNSEIGQLYIHNDGTFTQRNISLIKSIYLQLKLFNLMISLIS